MAAQRKPRPGNAPRAARPRRADSSTGTPPAAPTTPVEPDETPRIDAHLRHEFWRWGRIVFVLGSVVLIIQIFLAARHVFDAVVNVLLLVLFGAVAALLVAPLARALQRLHLSRGVAAATALLIGLVVMLGVVLAIAVPLGSQVKELSAALPRIERPFLDLQQWFQQRGVNIGIGTVESVLGISVNGATAESALANIARVTVGLLIDLVIVLVVAFWLLRDHVALRRGVLAVMPGRWRAEVDFTLGAFAVVFGGYLRGQLVLAAFVGVLSGFGCLLIGVPFPLLIGIAAGLFELIPLAGAFVGAAIGIVFALTVSPGLAGATAGLFLGIHIIDGYLISPRVQGRFVRLHPLVTILALLVGAEAGGFVGAFFAVPVASLLAAVARAQLADLRAEQPELFQQPEDAAALGRRRTMLAEYRVRPWAMLQGMRRRVARAVKG
ncbi:MAG TPA: AI-2E family transporter [Candidatus Dormibacteraeota bacterium]|nr:AI-2E family transporter [Candidatus Dormibacteraeota bacterium]